VARSLLSRLSNLVRADEDAIVAEAADPERALSDRVAELSQSIVEIEDAVVRSVGDLRLLEAQREQAQRQVQDWAAKAAAAAGRSLTLRATDAAGATRFDDLAKVALRHQLEHEDEVAALDGRCATHTELVDRLREGLDTIRVKRDHLTQQQAVLRSRGRLADAALETQRAVDHAQAVGADAADATLARMEDDVQRREALARAFEELDAAMPS
jgi:phage shock protein A